MAGDPLHAAFLAHLTAELAECGFMLPWTVKDTRNTVENPDASEPFVTFEIIPGATTQFTTGAPGANLHQEQGQITVGWAVPLGDEANQQLAGEYAYALFKRMLSTSPERNRFDCDGLIVRLFSPVRMGVGETEGGDWIETLAVSYEHFLVG